MARGAVGQEPRGAVVHGEEVELVELRATDVAAVDDEGEGAHDASDGHQGGHSATVEAVGDGVEGFAVGDRVVPANSGACGACPACERGLTAQCEAMVWLTGTLAEKLLVPVLAKLCNLVVDGGIWLNTQRPEWNDANNALAGRGLSMVTLCYLRRYLVFCQELFVHSEQTGFTLTKDVYDLFQAIQATLEKPPAPLSHGLTADVEGLALADHGHQLAEREVDPQAEESDQAERLARIEAALIAVTRASPLMIAVAGTVIDLGLFAHQPQLWAANRGGRFSEAWIDELERALELGMDIASGLHNKLVDVPRLVEAAERNGRQLFDVRHPTRTFEVANGKKRAGKRLLTGESLFMTIFIAGVVFIIIGSLFRGADWEFIYPWNLPTGGGH